MCVLKTQSNIRGRDFCKYSQLLSNVDYFCKKLHLRSRLTQKSECPGSTDVSAMQIPQCFGTTHGSIPAKFKATSNKLGQKRNQVKSFKDIKRSVIYFKIQPKKLKLMFSKSNDKKKS